jgi:uncharacterized protein
MSNTSRRLEQLDAQLLDLPEDVDAMLVSEVDGFIAGLITYPQFIEPSEWLPHIWGVRKDGSPPFRDAGQAKALHGLIMDHYNATLRALQLGRYVPVFDIDTVTDDVLWELWVEGFGAAMQLRPDAWNEVAGGSGYTQEALSRLSGPMSLPTHPVFQKRSGRASMNALPILSPCGSRICMIGRVGIIRVVRATNSQLCLSMSDATIHVLVDRARSSRSAAVSSCPKPTSEHPERRKARETRGACTLPPRNGRSPMALPLAVAHR